MKKLTLIAAGYALSVLGAGLVVAVRDLFIPADVAQNSGGMVAFGDMILFVLAAGFFSLAPTWFLLKLSVEKAPRALLIALLLIAATGPPSWLALAYLTDAGVPNLPQAAGELLGLLIVFGALPRVVAGPVFLVIEGVAVLLTRGYVTRALVAAAMLMDLVPLSLFALHLASAADLKSLTHVLQTLSQGLQIESGTGIICLLVPFTFRSPRENLAEM